MWQEARKQEKKIRGMMVDHKKRAERRREYYEKIKQDPAQFLQAYGRPCKIHIDAAIAAAADSPANMMPWQGQKDNMIDRFDGRAHLDIIPEYNSASDNINQSSNKSTEKREQRALNYERYRILVQNDFLKIPEERFLRTIELEEQYGGKTYQATKAKEDKRKIKKEGKIGAAIGFNYDQEDAIKGQELVSASIFSKNSEMTNSFQTLDRDINNDIGLESENINTIDEDSEDEDSDLDLDLTVDIMALNPEQRVEINSKGKTYGLGKEDFIKSLAKDIEEAAELKHAKEKEEEKAMFSGRKSRRERRIIREKQLAGRKLSPPSYAVSNSDELNSKRNRHIGDSGSSDSDSNSSKASSDSSYGSLSKTGRTNKRKRRRQDIRKNKLSAKSSKVEFITTFGGSGPESEGIDDRENEKDKIQAARRQDAQMKLKKLRCNESPPPIIGPLLPPDSARGTAENHTRGAASGGLYQNKRKGNNYRNSNKGRSRSKSPLSDSKYRRKEESYKESRRRSRSRGRYSRSPKSNRGYNSSRRRSSSRGRSKSPRSRYRRRSRSRSRTRHSRSCSPNRDSSKMRRERERSSDQMKKYEPSKLKTQVRKKSRSRSPSKISFETRYLSENGSKSNYRSINSVDEEYHSSEKNNKSKEQNSSDSSSSEEETTNKYRSKYRNKRRSSSSSDKEEETTPEKTAKTKIHTSNQYEDTNESEAITSNPDNSTSSPLVMAKKMLAISTAKEKENPVNVVILRNDLTKICDDKQGRKQDCDDKIRSPNSDQKYLNKNERVKAPPPPTIRPKSPESPPLKRYYKRALRRAGGSSSDEISDGEQEELNHDNSSGQYAISGIKPHSNDRAIANTMGQSLYATTSTSLSRITNSNIQPSSNSVVLDAKAKAAVKDKIKKRVQAAIKRQFKADQKAEEARKQRNEEERLYREEEMRDIALKLRKREREKAGISSSVGDAIPPLMPDWEMQALDENREFHSGRRRSRSNSNERFDKSPYRRSSSRSPKSRIRKNRSKSPNETNYSSSRREHDRSRGLERRRNKLSRSRSRSPGDYKKSNKSKLKLVDY